MGTCPPRKNLLRMKRYREKKYGEPFVILRASNGEACIMPLREIQKRKDSQ